MDELNNQPDQDDKPDQNTELDEQNTSGGEPSQQDFNSQKPVKKPISPVVAGFIGLIGGFILYQVLGGALTLLILGFDIEKAPVNSVRLMTVAGQILFMLLPALIFSKMFFADVGTMVRAKLPKLQEVMLFLLGIVTLIFLLENFIVIQNYYIEHWAVKSATIKQVKSFFDSMNDLVDKTYGSLLTAHNIFEGIFVTIVIALVPAVCEETMFRGFVQRSFEFRMKPFWAALITAVFFGIYHFSPYGVIALISLGLYFGFAAYMSNSIVVPMILHFFNNFLSILLYFLSGKEDLMDTKAISPDEFKMSVPSFFISLIIFSGIVILIKKYYSQFRTK